MARGHEPVGLGNPCEPPVELAIGQLDDPVALGADEVVVMVIATESVTGLSGAVHQRVDDPSLAQQR